MKRHTSNALLKRFIGATRLLVLIGGSLAVLPGVTAARGATAECGGSRQGPRHPVAALIAVPNLIRTDPYGGADITSNTYYDWLIDRGFLLVTGQVYVGQFLSTLKDYPQRQKAASFNLADVMRKMQEGQK